MRELALVTGASMGLGEEYARQLARRDIDLVLAARSGDRMREIAAQLESQHQTSVHVIPVDLSLQVGAEEVMLYLERHNLRPNWLINNAGFGDAGAFENLEPKRVRDIGMVNMVTLTELTSRMLPMLKEAPRGTARILNISSVAGFQPVPYFGVYSASKAYVLSFSEALHEEMRPLGIRVTCVCPGYTETNFAANNGIDKKFFKSAQSAEAVVKMSLEASDKGRPLIITRSTLQVLAAKFLPRALTRKAAAVIARSYRD